MIAKSITYTDPFTEEKVTKTFYFHISKAELIELEHSTTGGLSNVIQLITETGENEKLIPLFKEIISISYGVRTETGGFRKSKELAEEFIASEAYSSLFMSFFDSDVLLDFVQGILPKDMAKELENKYPNGIDDPKKVIEQIKRENDVSKDHNTAKGTVE